jgi:hypothetical protein
MSAWRTRLVLALTGCLLALLGAELVGRIVYTEPWYDRLLQEQTGETGKLSTRRNSLGLRDREYAREKPAGTKRILVIGDSVTYGYGVPDELAPFTERLERALNREDEGTGPPVEILNAGIPGSLTTEWVQLFTLLSGAFEPDAVVLVFFLRDGTRTAAKPFFDSIRDELEARHDSSGLYRFSYLFRLFRDLRDRDHFSSTYSRAIEDSYLGNAEQTAEWAIAKENILEIAALARASGIETAVVVFPILVELNERYPFARVCDVIVDFCRENELRVLDLRPAFLGKDAPDLWVSPLDQHPNAIAHRIAANALLPLMKELIAD